MNPGWCNKTAEVRESPRQGRSWRLFPQLAEGIRDALPFLVVTVAGRASGASTGGGGSDDTEHESKLTNGDPGNVRREEEDRCHDHQDGAERPSERGAENLAANQSLKPPHRLRHFLTADEGRRTKEPAKLDVKYAGRNHSNRGLIANVRRRHVRKHGLPGVP